VRENSGGNLRYQKLASSDFSLIIEGETGTGKSLVANIIHNLSARAKGPFIVLDLSVLPENLVESELFGYEKGAFTGADKRKKGYFELADGGTVFIDELQNMSPFIQTKILKAVDEKQFYPVGSDHPVQSDMRIIGATNSCIRKAVQEKTFREDLYYRLNEASLRLPPLRDRRDDIGFFIRKFLLEVSSELYKPLRITDDRIFAFLTEQRWPGNVRELKNVIRRAALFSESNILTLEDVTRAMSEVSVSSQPMDLPGLQGCFGPLSIPEAEKYAIRLALDHTGGNKTKAAGILQITLKTLLTKIKKYSL
jgi:transcriptional regulator with PAS, ATPase and Fis domain